MADQSLLEFSDTDITETSFPTITPSEEDAQLARESSRSFARLKPRDKVTLRANSDGGEEVAVIPKAVFRMLMDILTEISKGNAVTFVPISAELTTQQAADLLNVSRPFLIKLLEDGKITGVRKVGSHRRIPSRSVIEYKRCVDQSRVETLKELVAEAEELGME